MKENKEVIEVGMVKSALAALGVKVTRPPASCPPPAPDVRCEIDGKPVWIEVTRLTEGVDRIVAENAESQRLARLVQERLAPVKGAGHLTVTFSTPGRWKRQAVTDIADSLSEFVREQAAPGSHVFHTAALPEALQVIEWLHMTVTDQPDHLHVVADTRYESPEWLGHRLAERIDHKEALAKKEYRAAVGGDTLWLLVQLYDFYTVADIDKSGYHYTGHGFDAVYVMEGYSQGTAAVEL